MGIYPVHCGQLGRPIHALRGMRVMLSTDLAELYEVPVRQLVQAVKRNTARFPSDFVFQLDQQEFAILKSQIVISSWGGARRALPYAFTEQGVAMLSSVLRSPRAIQVNVAIMRAFVRLREALQVTRELAARLKDLEQKVTGHDEDLMKVFRAINDLMNPPPLPPSRPIGFHVRESRARYGKGT